MRLVPLDRARQALPEIGRRRKPEGRARTRHVERSTGLSVGLRAIEDEIAAKPDELGDQVREIADADLESRAEVHRLRRVVPLRRIHDASGAVLDVEELACGVARAPARDGRRAAVHTLDELSNE